jgi:hypothetical protein
LTFVSAPFATDKSPESGSAFTSKSIARVGDPAKDGWR